ncbi:TetR/AcrR family transcriptional regulator [Demetria terragena]|uniref:TetR/AcrR family transcriptional regulator n=1 Tax=Demetria terragena TaxID=63959 RepID=UPI0003604616|nr:TetR/AcrR family transcriptional regulator [Demetria terragena]
MKISATSAAERRALDRQLDVQHAACELVIEHGYDGFTMDQLAEKVGVSRRTLFNAVRDKESAVLGPKDDIDCHPALATFQDAEPSPEPFRDVIEFVRDIMVDVVSDHPRALECHRLVEQAIAADPKMQQLINDRFSIITELAAKLISGRQNWSEDDLRARVMARTLLALIQVCLDEFAQDDRAISEVFDDVVDAYWASVRPA